MAVHSFNHCASVAVIVPPALIVSAAERSTCSLEPACIVNVPLTVISAEPNSESHCALPANTNAPFTVTSALFACVTVTPEPTVSVFPAAIVVFPSIRYFATPATTPHVTFWPTVPPVMCTVAPLADVIVLLSRRYGK